MTRYVALLRAVNVGGTGKLPMTNLVEMCTQLGFTNVETYIASGNVIFDSGISPAKIRSGIQGSLLDWFGKPMGVTLRTATEIAAVLAANPFPQTEPSRTYAIFLDDAPPVDALAHATGQSTEELRLVGREIFIHYPQGMGRSKLKIPAAKSGTARNINTIARLAEIAAKA